MIPATASLLRPALPCPRRLKPASRYARRLGVPLLMLAVCGTSMAAEKKDFWYLQTSAYTKHWSYDPEHNNNQELIGLERNYADSTLWGITTFRNSFYQRSYYGYVGKTWENDTWPVYAKLTGGLIYGYKDDYQDKIPLNHLGIAQAIVPSVGAHLGPVGAEVVLLGTAAMMINVGYRF